MTLTLGRKSYTTRTAAYFYADTVAHKSSIHMRIHKEGAFWVAEPKNLWKYDVHSKEDL